MSVISGYGLQNLTATLGLSLAKLDTRLRTEIGQLASGLRIQTAADDPSGLAVAEGLQAQVNGHDQAASNTQTAINAITVADGALQSVTDLLQRLRSLCVKASNDLLTDGDRNNIQTECTQLQSQIDTISQTTTFNGLKLFGEPHSVKPVIADSTFSQLSTASEVTAPTGTPWIFSSPNAFGTSKIANVAYSQATYGIQAPPSGSAQVGELDRFGSEFFSQSLTGFAPGVAYALSFGFSQSSTNTNAGRTQQAVSVQVDGVQLTAYGPVPADPAHPTWTVFTTPSFIPGAGVHTIALQGLNNGVAFIDNVQITAIPSAAETAAQLNANQAYSVQNGANEGNVSSVQTATVNSQGLGIAQNSVASSTSAAVAEANIDSALDYVNGSRAILGAQSVTLQFQADNNTTASLNLTAAQSNIRDTNIAQSATALAKDQILSSVGQSILANVKILATSVERLFQ